MRSRRSADRNGVILPAAIERFFRLAEHRTAARTEVVAGVTTFVTMACITFVQPTDDAGRGAVAWDDPTEAIPALLTIVILTT